MSWVGRWPVQQQGQSVLRDHQLLVCRYDVDRNAAVGTRDQPRVTTIPGRIEREAEPSELVDDTCPNSSRVFADTGRKYKSVQALQRRRKHAGVETDTVYE